MSSNPYSYHGYAGPGQRHAESMSRSSGLFNNASYFTLHSPVINDVVVNNYGGGEHAMESLAKYTIPGAEFDSSARCPPPRCHPGTRKSIVEKVLRWFRETGRQKRLLWLVGPAGVGKSAIMQTISELEAESPNSMLGATIFFSKPNKRHESSKVFTTLAYQLAVKCPPYRHYVLEELSLDPKLQQKSMEMQFSRFIAKPFGQRMIHQGPGSLLIFLDGLDECQGTRAQCDIVGLISSFCLAYPDAPVIWVISSRPEPHLKAMFSRPDVVPSYEKEEVPINSDEGCEDVERYLQDEFGRIGGDYPFATFFSQWPTASQFLKIASAATGLFAYASAVIRFIDDPTYGDPVSQLERLLDVIDKVPQQSNKIHPLTYLDALYTWILSQIPESTFFNTKLILTHRASLERYIGLSDAQMAYLCNWSGMTPHTAYGALHHLHSVLMIPPPDKAEIYVILFHHQSFLEYLCDPERSGKFHISRADMLEKSLQSGLRILSDVYSSIHSEARADDPVSNIVLSWPVADRERVQLELYLDAGGRLFHTLGRSDPNIVLSTLQDKDVIHIMKSLDFFDLRFHFNELWILFVRFVDVIQHQFSQSPVGVELKRQTLLEETSIGMLDLSNIDTEVSVYVRREFNFDKSSDDVRGFDTFGDPMQNDRLWQGWGTEDYPDCQFASGPLSERSMQQVWRDLEFAKSCAPDTRILVFGNDIGRRFIYEFYTPDKAQCWTYIVPYKM